MFREMRYVYEVYRERSFSRAAQKLYISQPSLSLMIKKAEERVGSPLFDRSGTAVYPRRRADHGNRGLLSTIYQRYRGVS